MKKKLFLLCVLLTSLTAEVNVLAFSGSTRKDSYNQKLLQEAALILERMGAKVTIIHLNDFPMPFFDEDLEHQHGMPKQAQRLRNMMISSDAIMIASPEYNRSISAVLKNALDWVSRGEMGQDSAFIEKPFAIMSASPGKKGGSRGLDHLRTILEDVHAQVIAKQVSIPFAHKYFAEVERKENILLKEELQELLSHKSLSFIP